jgi:predicted nuclease of predicted toxin-antitoxin system
VADQIKLYMDEHVPTAVTVGLRLRSVDVLTAQEADMLAASDEDHLALAVREGRVLFTQDADFLRLHARGVPHAGIAYVRQQTPVGNIVRGLMLICQVLEPEDMLNHVEFL